MAKKTHEEFVKKFKKENLKMYNEITFLNEYSSYRKKIILKTKYGNIESKPLALLKAEKISIETSINPKEFWIKRAIDKREDSYFLDYSETNYVNSSTKIKIKCKKHNYNYLQRPSHHMANIQGCIYCMKSTIKYSINNIDTHNKFFNNHRCYLYVIELKSASESFFKVGITSVNRLKYRMNHLSKDYKLKIIYLQEGLTKDNFKLEQRLLKEFKVYKYEPLIKFHGYTECLTVNPIDRYYHWYYNI